MALEHARTAPGGTRILPGPPRQTPAIDLRRMYLLSEPQPFPRVTGRLDSTERKRYRNYTMEFEFDPEKSSANRKKHGIDFVKAQALWEDPGLIEIPVHTSDEPRFVIIGRIGRRHWSGIITYRGNSIRIISVRRSRPEEIEIYEG